MLASYICKRGISPGLAEIGIVLLGTIVLKPTRFTLQQDHMPEVASLCLNCTALLSKGSATCGGQHQEIAMVANKIIPTVLPASRSSAGSTLFWCNSNEQPFPEVGLPSNVQISNRCMGSYAWDSGISGIIFESSVLKTD